MDKPSYEELMERVARLEKQQQRGLVFKVSEKGGVSVYGMGRYPTTLYYEQWIKLLDAVEELRAFLEENKEKLKRRTE